MKRRSFLTGTGLAGLALISGCSKQQAPAAAEINADTAAELTLFYWDKVQTPTVEANLKRFNEKYPKIKVTTNVAGYQDYWKKLRTQAQARSCPMCSG